MSQPAPIHTIRTPDQRLRVFVSSTLEELAAERQAAMRAVTSLRLAPVMFETGARAHPPRSVYRAYLSQSDVFIGIYWQRYGWVAPDMDVSGLEDEFLLSGDLPRLIYLKSPAPEIEPRLADMLTRLRESGDTSYRKFGSADELEVLVADDLALLLTERFQTRPPMQTSELIPSQRDGAVAESSASRLPAELTSFYGRADEMSSVCELLTDRQCRLVTLTGPGGIGKTRLAVHASTAARPLFEAGVRFVPLESIADPRLIVPAIGLAFDLRDLGPEPPLDALAAQLRNVDALLVLDNFEHLVDEAGMVAELLAATSAITILVTSRQPLRIRGEHEVAVPAFALPAPDATVADIVGSEAVRFFVDRASAVSRAFSLDNDAAAVAAICRDLDGVPLAIELAAARVAVLPPSALRERLADRVGRRLTLLVDGPRDLPDRQRTLRATIEWSYQLLDEDEKTVFADLSCFLGGCTIEAAEAVCGNGDVDVFAVVSSLVEKSLLRVEETEAEPRLRMLETIRDFARECLTASGRADTVRERHATYYRDFTLRAGAALRGPEQGPWMARLSGNGRGDLDNVRQAVSALFDRRQMDDFAAMAWGLWLPAWMTGNLDEPRRAVAAGLDVDVAVSALARARMLSVLGMFSLWKGDVAAAAPALREALELGRSVDDQDVVAYTLITYALVAAVVEGEVLAKRLIDESLKLLRRSGDQWGQATGLVIKGWLCVALEDHVDNDDLFDDALRAADQAGDQLMVAMAQDNLAEHRLHVGSAEPVADLLAVALQRFRSLRAIYAGAYAVDGVARCAFVAGQPGDAARLLASADRMRAEIATPIWASALVRHERLVNRVRTALGDEEFAAASAEGSQLPFDEAVSAALETLGQLDSLSGRSVVR